MKLSDEFLGESSQEADWELPPEWFERLEASCAMIGCTPIEFTTNAVKAACMFVHLFRKEDA